MAGVLNLTHIATVDEPSPGPGEASAIYRGDKYERTLTFWLDTAETEPMVLTGFTAQAQIRETRLEPDVTPGAPLATFTCTIGGTDSNQVTVRLDASQTRGLPAAGVWDLQIVSDTDPEDVTTLVGGKVKVQNDVTDV